MPSDRPSISLLPPREAAMSSLNISLAAAAASNSSSESSSAATSKSCSPSLVSPRPSPRPRPSARLDELPVPDLYHWKNSSKSISPLPSASISLTAFASSASVRFSPICFASTDSSLASMVPPPSKSTVWNARRARALESSSAPAPPFFFHQSTKFACDTAPLSSTSSTPNTACSFS